MFVPTPLLAASISVYLFESPGLIIVGLAIVWMALRVVGRRTENKKVTRASWVPLVLIGVLWLTASLVTTKREHLEQRLKELLLAVEDKDTAGFRAIVLPDAKTQLLGQELSRDQVEARLDQTTIDDLILLSYTVALHDNDPTLGTTFIRVRAEGEASDTPGMTFSEWAIRWQYEDGQWRALRFVCEKIGADAIFNND